VCGLSIVGVEVSNPDEDMDVCFQCMLCTVQTAASATIQSLVQRSSTESVRD